MQRLEDVLDHDLELVAGGLFEDTMSPEESRMYAALAGKLEKETNDPKFAWRRRRDVSGGTQQA